MKRLLTATILALFVFALTGCGEGTGENSGAKLSPGGGTGKKSAPGGAMQGTQ